MVFGVVGASPVKYGVTSSNEPGVSGSVSDSKANTRPIVCPLESITSTPLMRPDWAAIDGARSSRVWNPLTADEGASANV